MKGCLLEWINIVVFGASSLSQDVFYKGIFICTLCRSHSLPFFHGRTKERKHIQCWNLSVGLPSFQNYENYMYFLYKLSNLWYSIFEAQNRDSTAQI